MFSIVFYHDVMMIWRAALFGQVPSRAIGWDVDCKTANLEHIAAQKARKKAENQVANKIQMLSYLLL
jgi:hypothetical protein